MQHPALPGGWGTVSSIGCGSVHAVPAMLTQIHSNNPPAAYTLLGGGYLALFTLYPSTNLSSWKGASHSLWSKQSLAHLSSLCYNNSLHPQNWETSLQHNHLCCLLITTTAYKRRDGNRCVTHTITATLQIQPYCSYRGLVVARSPAPAAAAGLLLATEKNPQNVF